MLLMQRGVYWAAAWLAVFVGGAHMEAKQMREGEKWTGTGGHAPTLLSSVTAAWLVSDDPFTGGAHAVYWWNQLVRFVICKRWPICKDMRRRGRRWGSRGAGTQHAAAGRQRRRAVRPVLVGVLAHGDSGHRFQIRKHGWREDE